MISSYHWAGGTEAMLRFGPDTGPVVIAALPLFEEANRTRTFTVSILRALARIGVASILPDLPGTGESLFATEHLTVLRLQEAYASLAASVDAEGRHAYGVGLRSGALLDPRAALCGRWHLAPQSGADAMRELFRIKQAELGGSKRLGAYWYFNGSGEGEARPVEVAGNVISPDLLAELKLRTPFDQPGIPLRVVRLDTDPKPADIKIDGAPLWRRSEPGNDYDLAQTLAADIAGWIAACER